MTSFSPTDAAFEGFRLTRERPRAVIAWAAVYLVFTFLIGLVADITLGPQSKALLTDLQQARGDPAAFWAGAHKLAPFFLVGLPLSLIFQGIFTCAIYRAVLRPEDSKTAYLRLGLDELRMMLLNLILDIIWGVTIFAVILVAALAAAAAGTGSANGMVLVGDVLTAATFCAAVTILVRLSLAAPMTFAEGRIRVFASWSLTRGRFWRLLAAYALALALAGVVLVLMLLIAMAAAGILTQVSGSLLTAMMSATSSPLGIAAAFVSEAAEVLILTCFYVVLKAWSAYAYKALAGPGPAETFA